jgi:hypothetical protein
MFKILALILLPLVSFSQVKHTIDVEDHAVHVTVKDQLTDLQVMILFYDIDRMAPTAYRLYDRYIYCNGTVYYRAGTSANKKFFYVKENGRFHKKRIV